MSSDTVRVTDAHKTETFKGEKENTFAPPSAEDFRAVSEKEWRNIFEKAKEHLPDFRIVTTNQSVAVDALKNLLLPPGYERNSVRYALIHFNSTEKKTQVYALLKDKTEAERREIARAFKEKTGKSLDDALKVAFDGHVLEGALGLLHKSDKSSGDAERIRTTLVERSQTFAGRSDKTCESDLIDTISTLNSKQIAELSKEYKAKYGVILEDALLKDKNLTEKTKQVLQIYLKGADRVTTVDKNTLANLAVKGGDLSLLQRVFRDAPQDLRNYFSKKYSERDLERVFGSDAKHALDYIKQGKLSAATEVYENTTTLGDNEDAIERSLAAMTDAERASFVRGRELSKAIKDESQLQNPDDKKALAHYQQLEKALRRAGNSTEMLRWHDMIENRGGTLVSKLAEHRGTIRWTNDDTGKIISTVEKMSKEDWKKLKEEPAFKGRVIDMLKSYLSDADVTRVKTILEQKITAKTFEESQGARRDLLDVISDNKGVHTGAYTLIGIMPKAGYDPQKILDAIISMPLSEQKKYREDLEFRKMVDRAIADSMNGGPALDTARSLLDKISKGESPAASIVDKINMRTLAGYDSSVVIRDIKEALSADPKLAARLRDGFKSGASEADRKFLESVLEAARKATSSSTVRDLVKPLIESGKIDLVKQVDLSNHTFSTDRKGIYEDLSKLSKVERKRLIADKSLQDKVFASLSVDEQKLAIKIVEQGEIRTEDKLRAAILEREGKDVKDILSTLSSAEIQALRINYAAKYGELSIDIARELSGREKTVALNATRKPGTARQEFNYSRDDVDSSRDGLGSRFANTWDGTGYQVDSILHQYAARMAETAKSFKDLPIEEQKKFKEQLSVALDKFVESKGELVDGVVNISMIIAGVGGAVFTGGASLSLILKAMAAGAIFKTAARAILMGEDYDPTKREVLIDILSGGADGALNVVSLGQISSAMKYVSSAVNKAFKGVFHGADSVYSKEFVEGISKSFGQFFEQKLKSGKVDITHDELFSFFQTHMKGRSNEDIAEVTRLFGAALQRKMTEEAQTTLKNSLAKYDTGRSDTTDSFRSVVTKRASKSADPKDSEKHVQKDLSEKTTLIRSVEKLERVDVLPNGYSVKFENGQLVRVETPAGVRAELEGDSWKVFYPKNHPQYGMKTDSRTRFYINKDGELVQKSSSELFTYQKDGRIKRDVLPEMMMVKGRVSDTLVAEYKNGFRDLPESIRALLADFKARIRIGRTLRESHLLLEYEVRKGLEKASFYDRLDGIYLEKKRMVLVPEWVQVNPMKNDGATHVLAEVPAKTIKHELGHAVDNSFKWFSLTPEFKAAYEYDLAKHVSKLSSTEREELHYFIAVSKDGSRNDSQLETFAELFAEIHKFPTADLPPTLHSAEVAIAMQRINTAYRFSAEQSLIERAFPNVKKLIEAKLKKLREDGN